MKSTEPPHIQTRKLVALPRRSGTIQLLFPISPFPDGMMTTCQLQTPLCSGTRNGTMATGSSRNSFNTKHAFLLNCPFTRIKIEVTKLLQSSKSWNWTYSHWFEPFIAVSNIYKKSWFGWIKFCDSPHYVLIFMSDFKTSSLPTQSTTSANILPVLLVRVSLHV